MQRNGGSGGFASLRTCVLGMGRVLGVGLSSVAAAPVLQTKPHHDDDDFEATPVWVLYVASMALVLLGGAFAGLTIAYVTSPSQDKTACPLVV